MILKKSSVLKNFFSLTGAEILSRLLGTLLSLYIARIFGASAYGQLSFAIAFISFFNIFADFGLTTLGIREIARKKDALSRYASSILFFQLALAASLYILLAIITIFLPIEITTKYLLLIFGLGMFPTAFDMSYLFQAVERMEFVPFARIASQTSYVLFGIVIVSLTHSVIALAIASTISLIIGASIAYIILKKKLALQLPSVSLSHIQTVAYMSLPFLSAAVLSTIYHNADSVILGFMKNTMEVGLYNAGYKVVNLTLVFLVFIANVFFPILSRTFPEDTKTFLSHGITFAKAMGLIAVPMTIAGFLLRAQTIQFLFGNTYSTSVPSYSLLLFLITFIAFNVVLSNILIAANQQKQNLISIAIGAGINIIANIILIPKYGSLGAAIATIAAELSVCIYLLIIYEHILQHIQHILEAFFIRPVLACIPFVIALVFIHNIPFLLQAGIAGTLYILSAILIKAIPQELLSYFKKA